VCTVESPPNEVYIDEGAAGSSASSVSRIVIRDIGRRSHVLCTDLRICAPSWGEDECSDSATPTIVEKPYANTATRKGFRNTANVNYEGIRIRISTVVMGTRTPVVVCCMVRTKMG
jgi:hypothetical protein